MKEGESIANFQAELKKLTKNCNFFCENCKKPTLNTRLRSQFIKGVRDSEIRVRLLQQSTNITFEEAVKLALAIESSKQESKEIQNPLQVNLINKNTNTVHKQDNIKLKTSDTKSNSAKFKCFKCGKNNHKANECKAKNLHCETCGKSGHKANECKAKNLHCETCGKSGHVKYVCFKTKRGKQNQLEEISEDPTKETVTYTINSINQINKGKCDKYIVEVEIEDTKCEMEVDTGAAVSTISLKQFKAKYPQTLIQPASILLRTYTGEVIKPGKSRVKIKYENQTTDGDIYVLNGNMDTILGRDWLTKIKINWSQLHKLTTGRSEDDYKSKMQNLLNKFDGVNYIN
ncbi:Retroviral aspartyl protease [Popillia japonica]|uniref:Retroviral aspartyl protease n=1 Tax=Popillia japonica TaxID=7064 RepID=A0AAW1JHP4_POPJA